MVANIEVPAKLHVTIKFLCDGNAHLVLIVVMEMVLMTMITMVMMMEVLMMVVM